LKLLAEMDSQLDSRVRESDEGDDRAMYDDFESGD